jgi:hypothetical protein
MKERELGRFAIRSEKYEEKILERVHENVSLEPSAAGVSKVGAQRDKSTGRRRYVFLMN